ncbi:mRNA splicing protein prp28 [Scheffersomyces spartinae]|uniref:RNA helicase n=1 Tax=Scheffersomyces spartinae TaxID=45513 RepID=A0A9P7VAS0_9ASCO|nr:mRNA splicing protein prp28 [Scheffersomyces spartinae]KAG7193959.1 mRNA splicing protein prp28 [Scheffersomyces spartinae]
MTALFISCNTEIEFDMVPISLEEIIESESDTTSARPKFLSKAQRLKLKEQRSQKDKDVKSVQRVPVRKRVSPMVEEIDEDNNNTIIQSKKKRNPQKRFAFDWNEEDDTSADFEPLVALPKRKLDIDLDDADDSRAVETQHWSKKPLEKMTLRDWRILRDDFNILAKGGGEIANPLRNWKEAHLPQQLEDTLITKLGYEVPTPIQRAAIPVSLSHRDVVGVAETGSGKTLGFLIPLLHYILHIEDQYLRHEHTMESNYNQCLGLILAPTRELAIQITEVALKFGKLLHLQVVQIIGGHTYEEQVHSVNQGVHIVVGTPGRILDAMERGIIGLSKCYYVVMDEADRMIDMGFEKQVMAIMDKLPTTKQLINSLDRTIFGTNKRISMMFTATISPPIEKMTKIYLENPAFLFIGNANKAVDTITQDFYYNDLPSTEDGYELHNSERFGKLVSILRSHIKLCQSSGGGGAVKPSIIIFANYKKTCDAIGYELGNCGFQDSVVIHGSKSQEARERAIQDFRSQKANILIATDVAARGIDIPNVTLVVNYQMPSKFDEYIHRIGRTGRAGNQGNSYSFVDDSNSDILVPLKKFLTKGGMKCPRWLLSHQATETRYLKD